jgi:hypothetical protein
MKVDVNINVKNVLSKFDWIIATIIRVSIIILMITSAYSRDWTIFFLSALVLFLTFFPKMVKRKWNLVAALYRRHIRGHKGLLS